MNISTEKAILEIRDMLREIVPKKDPPYPFANTPPFTLYNPYNGYPVGREDYEEPRLKEGVKMTKRGGYYQTGKGFIKKENAYE